LAGYWPQWRDGGAARRCAYIGASGGKSVERQRDGRRVGGNREREREKGRKREREREKDSERERDRWFFVIDIFHGAPGVCA